MNALPQIPTPTTKEVEKYLIRWKNLDKHYLAQQRVIDKLFADYPKNNDPDTVLLKACVLNDFYSTNIFAIFNISEHIHQLNIDQRLAHGYDPKLVNEIAKMKVRIKNKKTGKKEIKEKNFYSFATKYCSHHNPKEYPIYDSYVHKILAFFQKQDSFYGTKLPDLKNYDDFRKVLLAFRSFYKLDQFTILELDRYLWQLGKEHFQKTFKN